MSELLWEPSKEVVKKSNMTEFIDFTNEKFDLEIDGYFDFYDWSVVNIPEFWETMWEYGDVKASQDYDKVVGDLSKFPGSNWFVDAKLNFQ